MSKGKLRIKYGISFIVLLLIEIAIGKWSKGLVRGFVGDVLVIPMIYFMIRAIIFVYDRIFSVYVLPLLCYFLGWQAELLQAYDITGHLGIDKNSLIGIIIGGHFDLLDILAYMLGLYLIGIYLALESRDDRRWFYPIGVFIHWTWGFAQTLGGLMLYLWFYNSPHRYYRGVVLTEWPLQGGISLGMFIFAPHDRPEVIVHEYGHTFQALLLGPMYLLFIGIPSISWACFPVFDRLRNKRDIPYTWLYCEKWASYWGEKITKERAYW